MNDNYTPLHLTKGYEDATNVLASNEPLQRYPGAIETWHATTAHNLLHISADGLKSGSSVYEDYDQSNWGEATQWLDGFRPEGIPVSLTQCVFAQPLGAHILDRMAVYVSRYHQPGHNVYATRSDFFGSSSDMKEMLSVATDPELAYVAPGDIGEYARKTRSEEDAREYWKKTMTLKKFLELYECKQEEVKRDDGQDPIWAEWNLKDPGMADEEAGIPEQYDFAPEILIPLDESGTIIPDKIKLVASSILNRSVEHPVKRLAREDLD